MSMRIDMTWHDNDEMTFQASCADCAYVAGPFEDEESARDDWRGHQCA